MALKQNGEAQYYMPRWADVEGGPPSVIPNGGEKLGLG